MLVRSLLHVLVWSSCIAVLVGLGLFDNVTTKCGYHNYAERPWYFLRSSLPFITKMKMPANTLVNIGYVIVAIYWISKTHSMYSKGLFTNHQAYLGYVFAWMSLMYAPVQLIRILTQSHRMAILDQWYTLPIFSWVIVWASYILQGWNPGAITSIVSVSISSYCFTLLKIAGYEEIGFEVALTLHIVLAVISALYVYKKYPCTKAMLAFILGIFCCIGFVALKLADKQLAKHHFFFKVLSGHFWSKIADFMQIHFVFVFFFNIIEVMNNKVKHE